MPVISKYNVDPVSPIGKVLVINIRNFKDDPNGDKTRHGSEQDVESLKRVFNHLNFFIPTIETDLTKSQIIEAVKEFVKDLNKAPVDVCSLCIMSHGDKDYLMSHDNEEVSVEKDILEQFSNSNCPTMKGRPKMFLFQFCRGEDRETQRDDATPSLPAVRNISTLRDAIIAYSTVPGFVSYRDRGSGSWFIKAFCSVFEDSATNMEVQQLFKLVSKNLSDRNTTGPKGQEKQTMEVTYRSFEKDLFFKTAITTTSPAMLPDSASPAHVLTDSNQTQDSSICRLLGRFLLWLSMICLGTSNTNSSIEDNNNPENDEKFPLIKNYPKPEKPNSAIEDNKNQEKDEEFPLMKNDHQHEKNSLHREYDTLCNMEQKKIGARKTYDLAKQKQHCSKDKGLRIRLDLAWDDLKTAYEEYFEAIDDVNIALSSHNSEKHEKEFNDLQHEHEKLCMELN